jgi:DNA-binding transcriptional LysR family regulator
MSATTDRSWTSIWAAPDATVRAGAGLSVVPDFLVRDELSAGRLVQILPQWRLPSGDIYTVYPAARFRPPKVTRFVEMLVAAEQKVESGGQGRRG